MDSSRLPRLGLNDFILYFLTGAFTVQFSLPQIWRWSLTLYSYICGVLVTGSSPAQIQHFIHQLQASFALKDLGVPSYFLRLELTYTPQGVLLSQHKYITDILRKAHMDQVKPISTPMASGVSLSAHIGDVFGDPHLYWSIVGSL